MINQISWGAVLAGVVVALVTQIVLNMLGIGIGAATLDPVAGDSPSATSFSIGAAIWFAFSEHSGRTCWRPLVVQAFTHLPLKITVRLPLTGEASTMSAPAEPALWGARLQHRRVQ